MTPQFTLRKAKASDMIAVLEIYNDIVLNTTAIYNDQIRILEQQVEWFNTRVDSGYPIFVGEFENNVVGYCTYGSFRPWSCYKPTAEIGLHLNKSYRKRGFGTQMLEYLIKSATQEGYHSLIAGIDSENIKSINMHDKQGFKVVGNIQEVAYKFDRWLNLIFMQKILIKD